MSEDQKNKILDQIPKECKFEDIVPGFTKMYTEAALELYEEFGWGVEHPCYCCYVKDCEARKTDVSNNDDKRYIIPPKEEDLF